MLICSFLNTSINLVNSLSNLFFFKCWGYGICAVGSSIPVCFSISFLSFDFSTYFFSWGCSPCICSLWLAWSTSSVSTSFTTSGCPDAANSLPLRKVIALTCSLPSLLGFTSELLGSEPCNLSVNKVTFSPSAPPNFSTVLPSYSIGLIGSEYLPLFNS